MPEKEFNWGSVCIFVFYLFPGGGLAKNNKNVSVLERHLSV